MIDIRYPNKRRVFSRDLLASSVRYKFLYGSRLEDEDVILKISDNKHIQAFSNDYLVDVV